MMDVNGLFGCACTVDSCAGNTNEQCARAGHLVLESTREHASFVFVQCTGYPKTSGRAMEMGLLVSRM